MLIRAVSEDDMPQIMDLWNAMIRDTTATFTTLEKTKADLNALRADRQDAFLVAEVQGRIAGFVTWGPFRSGPGYAQTAEHTIITAEPRRGVGRALMDAAMTQAKRQGLHVMIGGISGENPSAIAFHQRLGFAMAGQLSQVGRKNGRWLDLILMSKPIEAR